MGSLMDGNVTSNIVTDENFKADSTGANVNRLVGQGLTFGLQDEIDAFLKSAFNKDLSYADALKNEREQLANFRKNNPVTAFGSEMAGNLPYAPLSVGKNLLSTFIRNAGMGGAYGAGTGEGLEDRAKNAGVTAGISGTLGTILSKILPRRTPESQKLQEAGIEVTPGQANRGTLVGNIIDYFEKRATGLPIIGDFISSAFDRGSRDFQFKIFKDFAESVGIKLDNQLKDADKFTIFNKVNEAYRKKYDDAVGKLVLDKDQFTKEMTDFAISKGLNKNQANEFVRKASVEITNLKDKKITGEFVQATDRLLRDLMNDNNLTIDTKRLYEMFYEDLFDANLKMNSKTGALIAYNNVKKYYPYFKTIEKSVGKTTADTMTPTNVLSAGKLGKGGSVKYATGTAPYQDIASTAKNVIGDKVGDSGTQSRLGTQSLLLGGGLGTGYAMGQGVDPLMAIGSASIPFASYATPITNKAMTNFVIPGASNYLRSATNPGSVEIKDRGKMMMNNMGLLGN